MAFTQSELEEIRDWLIANSTTDVTSLTEVGAITNTQITIPAVDKATGAVVSVPLTAIAAYIDSLNTQNNTSALKAVKAAAGAAKAEADLRYVIETTGIDISDLGTRMNTAEDDIDGIEGDIANIGTRFDANEQKVADLIDNLFTVLTPDTVVNYALTGEGKFGQGTSYGHAVVPVTPGQIYFIENYHESADNVRYALAFSDECVAGGDIPLVTGTTVKQVSHGTKEFVKIPGGCSFLLFNYRSYQCRLYGLTDDAVFSTGEKVGLTGIDGFPTEGSNNVVKSGGVMSAIAGMVTFTEANNVMASATSIYKDDVAEIFLTEMADVDGLSRVSLKCFNDRIYMKGFGVGSVLLYVLGGTSVSGWVDNRAYGLVCSQSNCGGIAVGDTGAYIVFRNVAAFRGEHESSDDHININLRRARTLSLNPISAAGLTPFVLPDGTVTTAKMAEEAITTAKIADDAVTPQKATFFKAEMLSKNLCNPVDIESGKYVNTDTGNINTADISGRYATGFIPIDEAGLICNKSVSGGNVVGMAYYDEGKIYISGLKRTGFFPYIPAAAYVRLTVESDEGVMVNKGDVQLPYEAYTSETRPVIPAEYLPDTPPKIPDGAVTCAKIGVSAVTTEKVADGAVTPSKSSFFRNERLSKNLCNPAGIESGKYIRTTNGKATNTSTANRFATGFIPIDVEGVICNKAYSGGTEIGYAYYDSVGDFMSGRKATGFIPYIDGAAYVRMTLNSNEDVMVNKGSVLLAYEAYTEEAREVIAPEYLPEPSSEVEDGGITTAKLADGAVTEDKLSGAVIARLGNTAVSINLPDIIPVRVGDTIRIYFRSVVVAVDPYIYDIYAVSSVGKSYLRYYEYKPTGPGTQSAALYVKNSVGTVLASKTFSMVAYSSMSAPASQTNILVIGASATASGHVAGELKRRLTDNSGDGTALNPTGLGLSNIAFVGRKTGSEVTTVNQEATGGWSWLDYATKGRKAYRFVVSGVDTLSIGSTYRNNGTTFTIEEINVTEGSGNIRCTFSPDSGSPTGSGSLTRYSGGGDGSISFSAASLEEFNPFWNEATGRLDFAAYADEYCNGHIDVLVSHCGVNDIATKSIGTFPSRVEQYLKPFVRAFHAQFPDGIFVFSTLPIGTPFGGFAASYGAHSQLNYYLFARKVWEVADCVRAMAEEDEFNSYFFVSEVTPFFDAESLYPTGQRAVALRSEETEMVQTNAVHPAVAGRKTVADCIFETLNALFS